MVSEQLDRKFKGEEGDVLILVLVEDGLRVLHYRLFWF